VRPVLIACVRPKRHDRTDAGPDASRTQRRRRRGGWQPQGAVKRSLGDGLQEEAIPKLRLRLPPIVLVAPAESMVFFEWFWLGLRPVW